MKNLIFSPSSPYAGQVARSASPVTTVDPGMSRTPCWMSDRHIAVAVVPAQATISRSGFASFTWRANGVKSVAEGTRILLTV